MAAFTFTNGYVSINSVDLSDHALSITLNYSGDLQEDTAMSDTNRTRLSGLTDWSIEVNFKQDFAASKVDATLFSLVGGAAVTVAVRPDAGSITSTNPEFTGSAILESYPILGNAVGELAQSSVTFQAAGTLTRSTS